MTEERGERIVHLIPVSLKQYNSQGLICTILAHNRGRLALCMLTASDDLVGKIVMKQFVAVCFILLGG